MISIAKTAMTLGRTLYTTKTAGARATTLFDEFCKTMSNPKIVNKHAARIEEDIIQKQEDLKNIVDEILKKSGVDALAPDRVKGAGSTASKIQKKFNSFKNKDYDSVREQIQDVILGNGPRELVGDSYGFRFIINSEKTGAKRSSTKLYESILDCQKQHKDTFSLTSFEDYYGQGIKPYGSEAIADKFAQLQYSAPSGKIKETVAAFTEKPSGYTRTNINGRINGVNVEIQVGGKYTTKWGDVEHILYDMRQGKPLDMSHYTPEQKELALNIQKAYQEILARKSGNTAAKFSEVYLNKVWETFRKAEIQGLQEPIYPPFPDGYPQILKVENILKLAHV